jgi:acetylornithine deacetylase/succinyl-diaminopimelate desuccinylase-like protein
MIWIFHNGVQRAASPSRTLLVLLATAMIAVPGLAPTVVGAKSQRPLSPHDQLARDVFKELIEIDTTHSSGDTTKAAEAMAARLRSAGFPDSDVQVIGPRTRNRNLVVRLRGSGVRRPILLLAHLDVVEARREDWSLDPFKLTEQDGYFYGRGTMDIKDGAAILVADMIRLKQEGYTPDRDLILALTAGEESGGDYNGVEWLVAGHRELIDAVYCINMDAGDPQIKDGKRIARTVQSSEKVYIDFQLEVRSAGGHSSLPTRDNAIYRLAEGLSRLAKFDFPVGLNETTKAYFSRMAAIEKNPAMAADMKALGGAVPPLAVIKRLSRSPYYNAMLRTTCVATQLEAGHAPNALPQMARANMNCRMLPGHSPDEVQRTIERILADPGIKVTQVAKPHLSPPSPLTPEVMGPVEQVTARLWPGVPVIPVLEVGATDAIYLRTAGIPTYGVSGVFIDVDDVRAHGKDERIGVKEYYEGAEYMYQLIKALSSK